MNEKLNELLQDEEFIKKLVGLEKDTEIQSLLSENGVELSLAEIAAIKKGVETRMGGSEELSDDDLESVAGGVDVAGIIESVAKGISSIGDAVHKWTRGRW